MTTKRALAAAMLFAAGCERLLLPSTQDYTVIPFDLGKNGVANVRRDPAVPGYYNFTILFPDVTRSQVLTEKEKWPARIPVRIHMLIKTNGETALDTNVLEARFSSISDSKHTVAYALPGFSLSSGATVNCELSDATPGPERRAELLFARVRPK